MSSWNEWLKENTVSNETSIITKILNEKFKDEVINEGIISHQKESLDYHQYTGTLKRDVYTHDDKTIPKGTKVLASYHVRSNQTVVHKKHPNDYKQDMHSGVLKGHFTDHIE